ncbi:MAG: glycine oxidase ThiO [Acidobacteriia bacterium]|nr:glycine oxidase ThiO [Terriglobia bacterium]
MSTCDVLIVGGGIIGTSVALELSQRKLSVAVVDRQEFLLEASWAAAGMLSPAPDCPAAIPLVPLGRASLALYARYVADIEEASGLRTGYRAGGAIETLCHGDAERELSTLVALHHGLGLACEALPLDEALEMEPALGRDVRAAALLPDECTVNTRRLTAALLAAAENSGVTLLPGVEAIALAGEGNRSTGVKTSVGKTLSAGHVVFAAGCWTSRIPEVARYAPTVPVRGQMAALVHAGRPIRRVLRSERGYIVPRDFGSPQMLVVGSTLENAGYEKGVTSGGMEKIFSGVNELVPELARAEITETWSGLRPGTPDQLPILGPTDMEGLLLATGHYRNGILLAPVTAKLIAEWITEGRTSIGWEEFSPLRFARGNAERPAANSGGN